MVPKVLLYVQFLEIFYDTHLSIKLVYKSRCSFVDLNSFLGKYLFFLLAPLWSDVSGACIKGGNERGGIAVSSLADCKRRCETETSFKCRSIGYWKPWWMTTKRLCNLSKENRQSAGTNYKKNCHIPNYHYSEITQEGW